MIPKRLFTSYKCEKENIIESILNDWKVLNPTFEVLYFSDNDVEDFFKETPLYDYFKLLRNGVAKSDLFRICYIQMNGGYWFDIDIEPFEIKFEIPRSINIHLFDLGFANISYMFIGGTPNLLFKEVIHKVLQNIKQNYPLKLNPILNITGPRVIQKIISDKFNRKIVDGTLPGNINPVKFLMGTDYEFVFQKIETPCKKTSRYKELQRKNNQLDYSCYNYI